MPIVPRSYDDYAALPPDLQRWELIEGELFMSPAPTSFHQKLITRLVWMLAEQLETSGSASVFPAPFDVILSRNTTVQPDVVVIRKERIQLVTPRGLEAPPDLAIEVVSASSKVQDRAVKRSLYAKFGVPEYWLVDPDAQNVEILVLGQGAYGQHVIFGAGDVLRSPQFDAVSMDVTKLFAPIA